MKVAYTRVSTKQQDYQNQLAALEAAGCEKFFFEKESAVKKRPELEKALEFVREGDTLIVTALDRLGRSTHDLWQIAEQLKNKRVDLTVLNTAIDTTTPLGSLNFSIIAAFAEFERSLTLKRTQEGREQAKARGVKFGRKKTIANDEQKLEAIRKDVIEGQLTMQEIAHKYSISRDRIYKLIGSRQSITGDQAPCVPLD